MASREARESCASPGASCRRVAAVVLGTLLGCDAPDERGPTGDDRGEPGESRTTGGSPPVASLDPAALELIAALGRGPHEISWHGDEVITPVQMPALLKLGSRAVPTILHAIETTTDDWTRDCLIEVAGRLGDRRARPILERMLEADT